MNYTTDYVIELKTIAFIVNIKEITYRQTNVKQITCRQKHIRRQFSKIKL